MRVNCLRRSIDLIDDDDDMKSKIIFVFFTPPAHLIEQNIFLHN